MIGRAVLVLTDSSRIWRQVSSPLAGAGNRVIRAATADRAQDFVEAAAVDAVLFDWSLRKEADALIATARNRVPVVALVDNDGREAMLELICRRQLSHICTARADERGVMIFDPAELVATVEKILRRDCFGLEKYIAGYGIQLTRQVIVNAEQRDPLIRQLSEVVRTMGGSRRTVDAVALVADELVTNAVYNAPRDADGNPRYAHVSRRNKITLDPTEYVRLDYGSDGRNFGLAVVDNFGALETATLRSGVERCMVADDPIQQKAGGAGLGLYTALSETNQLVVNVEPGVRTEVIALWSIGQRRRRMSTGVGSLHVFSGGDEVRKEGGVPRPLVELSESARTDLCELGLLTSDERLSPVQAKRPTLPGIALPVDRSRPIPRGTAAHEDELGVGLMGLHGMTLLRPSAGPGLDTVIARIRGSGKLSDAIEAAMTFLLSEWPTALMLLREGERFVPWTVAGNTGAWNVLASGSTGLTDPEGDRAVTAPIRADLALGTQDNWMRPRMSKAGVSAGPLSVEQEAQQLGVAIAGDKANYGLALSVAIDGAIAFVLFAAREQSRHSLPVKLDGYLRLAQELSNLCERLSGRPAVRAIPVSVDTDRHEVSDSEIIIFL